MFWRQKQNTRLECDELKRRRRVGLRDIHLINSDVMFSLYLIGILAVHFANKDKIENVEDAYRMSMLQQGMVFHSLQQPELCSYHTQHSYHVRSRWDDEAFKLTLTGLIARHAILRTVFSLRTARPLQMVLKAGAPDYTVTDLRAFTDSVKQVQLSEWLAAEKEQPIDLEGLPWRLAVHILRDDEFVFGMTFHHAILDGWSNATLVNELLSSYTQALTSGTLPVLDVPPAYTHYIALEQKALAAPANQHYWRDKFAGARLAW